MPLYEYQCQSCGYLFEVLQKMSEEEKKICPACEEPALKRLISLSGFQLKGSGWYVTDFKDQGPKKENHSKESKSKEPIDSNKKSDSKNKQAVTQEKTVKSED